ncbi:hypothetical protein D3C86_1644030 [compost metagenome]
MDAALLVDVVEIQPRARVHLLAEHRRGAGQRGGLAEQDGVGRDAGLGGRGVGRACRAGCNDGACRQQAGKAPARDPRMQNHVNPRQKIQSVLVLLYPAAPARSVACEGVPARWPDCQAGLPGSAGTS